MSDSGDTLGRGVFIGCCVGAAIFLLANGLACAPSVCTTFWLGDTGFIGAIVGIGTLIAAIVAGVATWKSYQTTLETNAATRFQKAVELMGSPDSSSQIGGIWSALDVAKQYPQRYLAPTFKCLQAIITEGGRVVRSKLDPIEFRGHTSRWPTTTPAQLQAFVACTHVPNADRWPEALNADGTTEIYGGFLSNFTFSGLNLRTLNMRDFYFGSITFAGCDLRDCEISGVVNGKIAFRDCDLRGTVLDLVDDQGLVPGNWQVRFEVVNCSADETTLIRGRPLGSFIK